MPYVAADSKIQKKGAIAPAAENLKVGDSILSEDGEPVKIASITIEEGPVFQAVTGSEIVKGEGEDSDKTVLIGPKLSFDSCVRTTEGKFPLRRIPQGCRLLMADTEVPFERINLVSESNKLIKIEIEKGKSFYVDGFLVQ